jgi:hypothetical protein
VASGAGKGLTRMRQESQSNSFARGWAAASLMVACQLGYDGAPCPCLDGWTCCDDLCVEGATCPSIDGSGPVAPASSCPDCGPGENCIGGACRPPVADCAELSVGSPELEDGQYWLTSNDVPRRAYCDMTAKVELCNDGVMDHDGVTRDDSHLAFSLTSVLEAGGCRVWNVWARVDHRPLDALTTLNAEGSVIGNQACQPLGFRSDPADFDRADGCAYGMDEGWTSCGFQPVSDRVSIAPTLTKWSNNCPDCAVNGGIFPSYAVQGPIYQSRIPWNADGDIAVLCGL